MPVITSQSDEHPQFSGKSISGVSYKVGGEDFPFIELTVPKGVTFVGMDGARGWMDEGVFGVERKSGGFRRGLSRAFSGESYKSVHHTSSDETATITFPADTPGSISVVELKPFESITAQAGAMLCHDADISTATKLLSNNIKTGLFGGEGLIMQEITAGSKGGIAVLNTGGVLQSRSLEAGEQLRVSTGHVAFISDIDKMRAIRAPGGTRDRLFGAQGWFDTLIEGPCEVALQTMPLQNLAQAVARHLPQPTR